MNATDHEIQVYRVRDPFANYRDACRTRHKVLDLCI